MMGKSSKGACNSSSHQLFKDKAKSRIDDIQAMFKDLQFAMNESRTADIPLLQERMNTMLTDWKAELNQPSPASSHNDGSLGSFTSDLHRLLENDDATSPYIANLNPHSEANDQNAQVGDPWDLDIHQFQESFVNQTSTEHREFHETDQFEGSFSGQHSLINSTELSAQLNYHHHDIHHDIDHNLFIDYDGTSQTTDSVCQFSSLMYSIDPPSAFLGPKCALWDCVRPAKGLEGYQNYCDMYHADLAKKEGSPGCAPLMRCGGIDIKDGALFAALTAKTQGMDVGLPECEGAATMKSPWKSPELFNLDLVGETIREWFFFSKPQKFDSRGRKQKWNLPDHDGRGWHESRKQIVKESDGLKRSFYMDPQPLNNFEWHLFLYELDNTDTCALYRLEFKVLDDKKSPKGKVSDNSPADLRKQNTSDNGQSLRAAEMILLNDVSYNFGSPNQKNSTYESSSYGDYSAVPEHGDQGFARYVNSPTTPHDNMINNLEVVNRVNYDQFDSPQEFGSNRSAGFSGSWQCEENNKHNTPGLQPVIYDQSSAFSWQKCALWDCSRPAQGSNYCSTFHGNLALAEGGLSVTPVLRPKGISLKDGALFASLHARLQDKDVGIPECGEATMKAPWNVPALFDTIMLEGETIREWLFFDKPRKAFSSGNRKQRSLSDYKGGRWHASRTQVMKEYGGAKKSYYMDPQPMERMEWHLYEYEADTSNALTLFRLELKIVDGKKSPKGKVKDSIHDLQSQMGRLTAGLPIDDELSVKHETSDAACR